MGNCVGEYVAAGIILKSPPCEVGFFFLLYNTTPTHCCDRCRCCQVDEILHWHVFIHGVGCHHSAWAEGEAGRIGPGGGRWPRGARNPERRSYLGGRESPLGSAQA